MSFIIKWVFKTVVGRWVTGALITVLLGGAVTMWHNHKEGLIEEGQQACVQVINEETMDQLQLALEREQAKTEELRRIHAAALVVVEETKQRKREMQERLEELEDQMEAQRNTDEEYKEWTDTPLPAGVGERMRDQAASGN